MNDAFNDITKKKNDYYPENFEIKSTLLMIQYTKTLIMAYIDQVSQKHKTPMKRL